jgi:carbon dioxide concentrating mechanism protein CcmO
MSALPGSQPASYQPGSNQTGSNQPEPHHVGGSLGLVCTRSFPAIVGTADMMLKSSGVTLVGYEKTGDGYCTAVVRGGYADVRLAVEAGIKTAKQFGQYVSSIMLPRPMPNLEMVLPISSRFAEFAAQQGNYPPIGAIGLIETRGFPAMVGAADAAMKSANVELLTYETTGDGLCTAIIQGRVADVTIAVEAGMYEAERIGELHAIMVIPRPLDDIMRTMPKPPHLVVPIETVIRPGRQPLHLPQKEPAQPALFALPQLERVPVEAIAAQQESPELELVELEPIDLEAIRPERQIQAMELEIEPEAEDSES